MLLTPPDDGTDPEKLLDRVYGSFSNPDNTTADHLIGRAVLTPCNAQVDDLNNKALEKFPGELRTYNSADDVPELADGAYPPG